MNNRRRRRRDCRSCCCYHLAQENKGVLPWHACVHGDLLSLFYPYYDLLLYVGLRASSLFLNTILHKKCDAGRVVATGCVGRAWIICVYITLFIATTTHTRTYSSQSGVYYVLYYHSILSTQYIVKRYMLILAISGPEPCVASYVY